MRQRIRFTYALWLLAAVAVSILSATAAADTLDVMNLPADLINPSVMRGEPNPGKRVLQALPEYKVGDVRHALYLPTDWVPGKSYPVIAEFTGNGAAVADGRAALGYGISAGKGFIWVTLPFVSPDGKQDLDWWWGSPDRTADYATAALESICKEWGGDPNAVILTGHSRGAIACNYIGLRNDDIAKLWLGMVPCSHYDNRNWKQSEAEQARRIERLRRLGSTPQFICGETQLAEKHNDRRLLKTIRERKFDSVETATRELNLQSILDRENIRSFVSENHPKGNFTFDAYPWVNHDVDWILRDTPNRTKLRNWVNELVETKEVAPNPRPTTTDDLADRPSGRPNIVWIYVDDMSDWLGCYGDTIAQTPNIDALATAGTLFKNAFIPAPVCSAARSALITGTMQTTHGLHNHRTMIKKPLPDGIVTVPELFRQAGYLTFNEAKDDYNFQRDRNLMYSPEFHRPTAKQVKGHMIGRDVSWLEQLKQLKGKPFFGQIQLKGGKIGGETGSKFPSISRVADRHVTVPPQYPDHPVFRNAIARHYEQIAETDEQVGAIITGLKEYGLWENTAVFFFTDHGSPLPRAKQFLYEDGTKIPLVVHWPNGVTRIRGRGASRSDLVSAIDITATSLGLANIEIPEFMEGRDLFADDFEPRTFVISARDRMGNAIDRIRAVRSERFRYIRNYKLDRALYQPNYRENYATFTTLRELLEAEKLTALQASYHDVASRPKEELYDLKSDPHQTNNLAEDPEFAAAMKEHRAHLERWETETDDQGRYPEGEESLALVFKSSQGRCVTPEYDFLKSQDQRVPANQK